MSRKMKGYECLACGISFWTEKEPEVCPLCRDESVIATGRRLGEWKDEPTDAPSL